MNLRATREILTGLLIFAFLWALGAIVIDIAFDVVWAVAGWLADLIHTAFNPLIHH